jgi:ubiquitin conjugation factor E4 B
MLSTFKALQEQTPSQQLQQDIDRLEKDIELYSQEKLCYEAQILRVLDLFSLHLTSWKLFLNIKSLCLVLFSCEVTGV